MTYFELIVLGVGLAMDAVAVSMTNGMVYNNLKLRHYIAMPVFFGVFQAMMPVAGYFAGSIFADFLDTYSGIVILLILGIIGGKMVYEGITKKAGEEVKAHLTMGMLFFQAIATSIDAFAVGVAFTAMRVDIALAVSIIGIVTALLVAVAIVIGKKAGDLLGQKAEILGGIILIIIGLKAMVG